MANAKYCTDFVFGGTTKSGEDFPGTLMNENKTLLTIIMPLRSLLVGSTWNLVNESNGQGLHPHSQNTIIKQALNNEIKMWGIGAKNVFDSC
jgi:hypothetical protein